MDEFIYDIEKISFGVYSPDEIKKMSVCLLDNPKRNGYGTVYDERMGTIDFNQKCETCNKTSEFCHGHFGHIELCEPIINPLYFKHVVNFLKCICLKCNRILITRENIELLELDRYDGHEKFLEIFKKISKIDMCYQIDENGCKCGYNQPDIKLNVDNSISLSYKKQSEITLSVGEIKNIFDKVSDDDIRMLGFDPSLIHPTNLILVNLPVLPICDRPYVKCESNICDDDLTNQYIEIIKLNNNILKQDISEKRRKDIYSLEFRVSTMFNNSKGKAKHTTSSRSIKGIKERIVGKDGLIRNNMMGKRVNQSARTVIGPDPNLKTDQLAVPYKIAQILTIPEIVTRFNIDKINELMKQDKINYVIKPGGIKINIKYATRTKSTNLLYGDVIHRGDNKIGVMSGREELKEGDRIIRDGNFLENVIYPSKREYKLEYGDKVERQLQNGDLVLLNRQPTLHKGSMIAMEVVLKPHKTLRMNLACTKSFNADFDGDEMNLHVPQSIEAITELRYLSKIQNNIISPQASKTNIVIVQDSLLGAYKMTKDNSPVTREQFFNVSMKLERYNEECLFSRMNHIENVLDEKEKNPDCLNGRGLISLILPKTLNYVNNNKGCEEEPDIKIFRGVLYEGVLNKRVLGSSYNSLIQIIYKEYGVNEVMKFINDIQFITNEWNLLKGFSVGLKDCLIENPLTTWEVEKTIHKCFMEAECIKKMVKHPGIREVKINSILNKAKDVGLSLSKKYLNKSNNFISTVMSGSKGDFFNISQITGLLGQQNILGSRIKKTLDGNRRTLYHYPREPLCEKMEYESKGFISSSFIKGLNPREFFFHSMSGREGISDSALCTATSGYIQRRIVKLTEDMKITYNSTVNNSCDEIYQFIYNEDGFNPTQTVKVDGIQQCCDLDRLVDKLNSRFENMLNKIKF